jgi:hypothetical protein
MNLSGSSEHAPRAAQAHQNVSSRATATVVLYLNRPILEIPDDPQLPRLQSKFRRLFGLLRDRNIEEHLAEAPMALEHVRSTLNMLHRSLSSTERRTVSDTIPANLERRSGADHVVHDNPGFVPD